MPAHVMVLKAKYSKTIAQPFLGSRTRGLVDILKLLSVADNAKHRAYRLRLHSAVIKFLSADSYCPSLSTGIDRCDIGVGDSKDPWHVYYVSR